MRGGKEKWIPGTVVKIMGPLTYLVKVPGNNKRFVHVDHLLPDDSSSGTFASHYEVGLRGTHGFEQPFSTPHLVTPPVVY